MSSEPRRFLPRARLAELFQALRAAGYRIQGPQVRQGVLQFDELTDPGELPVGVRQLQAPGVSRLRPPNPNSTPGPDGPSGHAMSVPTRPDAALDARHPEASPVAPSLTGTEPPAASAPDQADTATRASEPAAAAAADDARCFAWANGPQALKPLNFAPTEPLWRVSDPANPGFAPIIPEVTPLAVIGVRACDLAALALQDRHFLGGARPDPWYQARRARLFLIGVDCSHPADTCFCASTGDGPALGQGFDLGLTELDEGFLIRAGSDRGTAVLADLTTAPPTTAQLAAATHQATAAVHAQTRRLPAPEVTHSLYDTLNDPAQQARWEAVAADCLACGNCTAVCPTCFCSRYDTDTPIGGTEGTQVRRWDSCFNAGHSALHGHPVRNEITQRYRQWVTHKLAGWQDQFGRPGCVGCGRCIAWCPVGIDLTAAVAQLTAALPSQGGAPSQASPSGGRP